MSKDLNTVVLAGRLTREPELKQTPNGVSVCSFSIACNDFKDKGNFFNVVAWKQTADFVHKYFSKGQKILIEGELMQESWEKDGKKQSTVKINARSVFFGESKSQANEKTEGGVEKTFNGTESNNAPGIDEGFNPFDDIPF